MRVSSSQHIIHIQMRTASTQLVNRQLLALLLLCLVLLWLLQRLPRRDLPVQLLVLLLPALLLALRSCFSVFASTKLWSLYSLSMAYKGHLRDIFEEYLRAISRLMNFSLNLLCSSILVVCFARSQESQLALSQMALSRNLTSDSFATSKPNFL